MRSLRHSYPTTISQSIGKEAIEARERAFLGTSFLLFAASVAGTIYWCGSMAGGMAMPGGWTMSMAWMKMPGQSWPGTIASFMGMWTVMMVAMMLPSLVPMLSRYRRSIRVRDDIRLSKLTLLAGVGYFFVWVVFGTVAYALGTSLAAIEMRWPALAGCVPLATGIVLLLAGCVQLSTVKARQLGRCREAPTCGQSLAGDAWGACRHGLGLGVHCGLCCFSFMLILLVSGVMNLGVMAILAVAINMERLLPWPETISRVNGFVTVAAAILVFVRALGNLQ
jgi:predicted metal-binding membrane protein